MKLAEAQRQYEELMKRMEPRNRSEKELVRQIGDAIGYGRTMQLCEEIWHEKEIAEGREHASGALVHGPCRAFMVPCPHTIKDWNGHCDICCGAGRITKGVAKLLQNVKSE
jgi:hypothetical protein